jgi:hypothetical protein
VGISLAELTCLTDESCAGLKEEVMRFMISTGAIPLVPFVLSAQTKASAGSNCS